MIRLIIAEREHMVRGALVALLEPEPDMTVVAEVGNGDEIVPAVRRWRPDVAIIDSDLSGLDGLTAATTLAGSDPACRVLILMSKGYPGHLRRALTDSVDGVLLKDTPPRLLAETVRKMVVGQRVIDPRVALTVWEENNALLTQREVEVLRLAAEGENVPRIAQQLHLSVGTVRNYLTAIVSKLNARNRVDAIRIARSSGLL